MKRGVFITAILALLAGGFAVLSNRAVDIAPFAANAASIWNGKKVEFDGLHFLSPATLKPYLPLSRSNLEWLIFPSRIEKELQKNDMVKKAVISSCSGDLFSQWGCFRIKIVEDRPADFVLGKNTGWIFSESGRFLATGHYDGDVVRARLGGRLFALNDVRILENLYDEGISPDMLKAKVEYMQKALGIVEGTTGFRCKKARLRENGELELFFNGIPFPIIFSYSEKAMSDTLVRESRRLKAVLEKLQREMADVKEIDLAYGSLVVVKMNGR